MPRCRELSFPTPQSLHSFCVMANNNTQSTASAEVSGSDSSSGSFSGRRREKRTHWSVIAGDRIAHALITVGGIGTIEGPILGTILFFVLREYLADLGSIYLMILGAVAIVVMLKAPSGLWGFLKTRFDVQIFPLSRRVMGNVSEEKEYGA